MFPLFLFFSTNPPPSLIPTLKQIPPPRAFIAQHLWGSEVLSVLFIHLIPTEMISVIWHIERWMPTSAQSAGFGCLFHMGLSIFLPRPAAPCPLPVSPLKEIHSKCTVTIITLYKTTVQLFSLLHPTHSISDNTTQLGSIFYRCRVLEKKISLSHFGLMLH